MDAARQVSFALDAAIDRQALRRAYVERRRATIAPFLAADAAEALRAHLAERTDWRLAIQAGGSKFVEIEVKDHEAMSPAQREALQRAAAPTEPSGFRYLFDQIVAVGNTPENREPDSPLGLFAGFLSSEVVLDLVRGITGARDIAFAEARATRYRPGHFLTVHDDRHEETHRRVAYTFGLSPVWRPEWGGLLMFHDGGQDVERGLVPRMNALNLFAVPRDHSVSLVAPFAPDPRYSVTGWMRALPGLG
ncbi:MAG TPA: 2OG-Fe(II) oxygenase family protein [Allosphingosinicella sp.]|nr:2OG-Fe(II) oxygenase family protein [Allosphingosinicella sp.]